MTDTPTNDTVVTEEVVVTPTPVTEEVVVEVAPEEVNAPTVAVEETAPTTA